MAALGVDKSSSVGPFRLVASDSSSECLDEAVNAATRALKANRDEARLCEVAQGIKKDLSTKYPGSWHVIVGSQFGAQVSHEAATVCAMFAGLIS